MPPMNLAGERPNALMALFNPAAHPQPNAGVPLDMLSHISLKVVANSAFTGVGTPKGPMAGRMRASGPLPISRWRVSDEGPQSLRGTRCGQGLLDARGGDRFVVSTRQILQVKDSSMVGLPDEHLVDFANH